MFDSNQDSGKRVELIQFVDSMSNSEAHNFAQDNPNFLGDLPLGFTGRVFNNTETSKPGPYSPVACFVLVSHTFIPGAVLPDEPVHFDNTNTGSAMN